MLAAKTQTIYALRTCNTFQKWWQFCTVNNVEYNHVIMKLNVKSSLNVLIVEQQNTHVVELFVELFYLNKLQLDNKNLCLLSDVPTNKNKIYVHKQTIIVDV